MPSEVQSVVFQKRYWTEERAIKWLQKHNFKAIKIDITPTQLRFRQKSPKKFKRFATKKAKKSVNLIIGFY